MGRAQISEGTKIVSLDGAAAGALAQPDRELDAWPYYTGHRILYFANGTLKWCTAASVNTPRTHMYTAGHCFNQGEMVQQGYFDQAQNTVYTTGNIGPVVSRQWGNNRIDAETVQIQGAGLYADRSYHGSVNDPADNTAFVKFEEFTGMRVCGNGSVSGTACTGEITQNNICVFYSDENVTTCGLNRARSMNGNPLSRPGDSGGSVVRDFFGSGVQVVGIISGNNDANDLFYTPMRPVCAQVAPFTCS